MQFNTWGDFVRVSREFHSTSFLMPVRASKDNVGEILRFLLASHTKLSYMESGVSADFVPHVYSTEGSVEGTSEALLCLVSTALQVSEALRAEAGFQASK
eukprot:2427278-Amphidinium_carterae.1